MKGSAAYWLLIVAALIPVFMSAGRWVNQAFSGFIWVSLFLLLSVAWSAIRGDGGSILPLLMLSLSWLYSQCSSAQISAVTVARLFVGLVVFGIGLKAVTNVNYYGILPWLADDLRADGRVSFAGNIGFAGVISLLVFVILIAQKTRSPIIWFALALSVYFVFFSRVRTALIGVALFGVMYWILSDRRPASARSYFIIGVSVVALTIVAISVAPLLLVSVHSAGWASDFFLQGKQSLSADDIQEQLYRPVLWATQLQLFLSSPYLMGWGSAAATMIETAGSTFLSGGDTVSFPTRLLAHHGLPGVLFIWAAMRALWRHAKARDVASVCAWPVCVLVMLSWGSIFHPTDAVGVLYLILTFRGVSAFK